MRMWLLAAVCVLVLPFIQGCAGIEIGPMVSDDDTTLSRVLVDDAFVCFGLEDEYREHKVPGETRIPAGRYPVQVRDTGGFDSRYRRRFGAAHQGMLHVTEVPNFRFILIHIGNNESHTAGCLLVGNGANAELGSMSLLSSARAYLRLYAMVINEAQAGALDIEYLDNDCAPPAPALA